MKRLTNLREVARKKIFSYVKMGLIIHLPNEVNHYASTHGGDINIQKTNIQLDTEDDDSPYSNVYGGNVCLVVWPDEKSYNERFQYGPTKAIYRIAFEITFPETNYPNNIYDEIYTKCKTFLHSYTDDI